MALTESNISRRAANELAFKLRLERPLALSLRRLFRDMARDLKVIYSATGHVQNANAYNAEIVGLLRPVYRKSAKEVGSLTRDNIKAVYHDFETKQNEPEEALLEFTTEQPVERAGFITSTNQTELGAAVFAVIAAAGAAGISLTNDQIANQAAREFTRRSMPRASMIAQTEVQNAVEGSKFVELDALARSGAMVGDVPAVQVAVREWVAVLDNLTRASHVTADGQRQGILSPFEVGNSRLNYPGDTSLGADLAEVINCRCGSHIVVNGDNI